MKNESLMQNFCKSFDDNNLYKKSGVLMRYKPPCTYGCCQINLLDKTQACLNSNLYQGGYKTGQSFVNENRFI